MTRVCTIRGIKSFERAPKGYDDQIQIGRKNVPFKSLAYYGTAKADLPNVTLRALSDRYKKNNAGNAPRVWRIRLLGGKEAFLFSLGAGLGYPASVFLHERRGKMIDRDAH